MNIEGYNQYWKEHYSDSLPLSHKLRHEYADRWFRIHSLPASKRYADTEDEFQIILNRQNQLISDLIGENEEIIIVFCNFSMESTNENYSIICGYSDFEIAKIIDLYQFLPEEEYPENFMMEVFIKSEKWINGKRDKMLRAIADDEIRVLIVCPSKKRIVAPYDGGVDVIMENENQRNAFRSKYKDWLSFREDGL